MQLPGKPALHTDPAVVRKPPLPGLVGIRTILAVGIMIFHFTPGMTPEVVRVVGPVIGGGFTFISFFLLISGFVLSYNYAHRADSLRPLKFYAARMARLYPVYLLSLVVSVDMFRAEWQVRPHGEFVLGTLLTPFFLQGWSPSLATFWNLVAWTLSTEVMLYLSFPFLIKMRWWPQDAKRLTLLFFAFWGCEILLPTIYILLNPDGLGVIDRYSSAYWLRALKYTPLPYLPIFLAGITLGRLNSAVEVSDRVRLLLTIAATAGVLGMFYFAVPRLPYVLLHGGLMTPIFAVLVFGLAGHHAIARFLGRGPVGAFGRASLCLYLLHFNTWLLLHDHHIPERLGVARFDPWFSYAFILAFAYTAYRLVEHPVQNFLLKRLYGTPSGTAQVAAPVE